MPPPPGSKALLRAYEPSLSLSHSLIRPYFLRGVASGVPLNSHKNDFLLQSNMSLPYVRQFPAGPDPAVCMHFTLVQSGFTFLLFIVAYCCCNNEQGKLRWNEMYIAWNIGSLLVYLCQLHGVVYLLLFAGLERAQAQ